jgi:murein DD-endopeptidase MepM/ murein hydrolase activator NlpD
MSLRARALVAAVVTAAVATGWSARAQVPGLPAGDPATTTTSTTTTTTAPPSGAGVPSEPAPPPPGPPPPSDAATGGGGDASSPGAGGRIPPGYAEIIASVRRSPANSTRRLLEALAPLQELGFTMEEAAIVGFGRFPVAGEATFGDDWFYPRFVPYFHLHVGTDIFAARGTPVRSPVDGVFRSTNGPIGGLAAYVTMPDGTYFYMAHLDALAPGLTDGQRVTTGQVVGYVGDSGNARGGKPHVHFEIHPRGGGPINPKPYLDRFVADAIARAPAVVAHYRALWERRLAQAAPVAAPPAVPEPPPAIEDPPDPVLSAPLVWAASMSPAAGPLRLAEAEVARAVATLDWDRAGRVAAERARAAATARRWLAPLAPAPWR